MSSAAPVQLIQPRRYGDARGWFTESYNRDTFAALGITCAPDPDGHVQATGRDAKVRKQYRYHPRFREFRESTKFEHMLEFALALPGIRATIADHTGRRACRAIGCWRPWSTCSRPP